MKSNRALWVILCGMVFMVAGCGGGGGGSDSPSRTLVSIAVTPSNTTLAAGNTLNFTATGTYSDNSTANITQSVNWSSSVPSVGTVSNAGGTKGSASGVAAGSTQIIAMNGNISGSTTLTVTGGPVASANVMTVTVNGSLCADSSYLNKPCVSVTICNPGSTNCRTVTDILLDTGSYGLRIFRSAISGLTLTPGTSGTGLLAECVQFADGSSLWGPVQVADVRLGSEQAVQIPIQVVDASFATRPPPCADADATPQAAGFTGILGVGMSAEDCGPLCASSDTIGFYYRCEGASCTGSTVSLQDQVQNPVARLPQHNNGVLIQLPSVPAGGVRSLNGTLTFGIGTSANNSASPSTILPTDHVGNFTTTYNDREVDSFLDTGSNALFFPNHPPALPICSEPNTEWYCPPQVRNLTATLAGAFGSPRKTEAFQVGNLTQLSGTSNRVFREIGGPSDFGFDWGLPFFMGRNVFIGIDGKSSVLGAGPYIAY